jgi:flagellar FliJ protein
MATPFSLKAVMDLARNDLDAATTRLGQAVQNLMNADRKLKTLLEYRSEYQAKFRDSVTSGIDSAGWRNFHLFLARLDAGIDGARVQAEHAREAARRAQEEWQEHQRRLKAFGVLAERHERAEATRDARREQRESDDRASGTFLRKSLTQRLR